MPALVTASWECNYPQLPYSTTLNNIVSVSLFLVISCLRSFSQPLHINAANEAYMLQRPSSLFWCHSIKSLSCLEISSVTLTPMSSPESNLSTGLLTPPPAKPALLPPKPNEGCSIPRPRVNTLRFSFSVLSLCPWSLVISCLCLCGACASSSSSSLALMQKKRKRKIAV